MPKPMTYRISKLHDLVAYQIGNYEFGIDDNFYQCGLDSLGSTMLIKDLLDNLKFPITLSELMEHATILELEALMNTKTEDNKATLAVQKVYPLTSIQKYFAYVIPGNTTGNLPFAFQLDKGVDLEQLKKAIYIVLDAHPSLKAVVKPNEQKYLAIYRDDNRVIDIPIQPISDAVAEVTMQELIKPFRYREDDNLVHIALFEGEEHKYLFFDVAHFMGDGVTMNILMEDLCRAYNGETVEKESYTTYDYILEEQLRESNGIRKDNIAYVNELLKNVKLSRSILNKSEILDLSEGKYASIRKRFTKLARRHVLYYGKQHGVSENAMFLAAFNYCIRLFSDEDIVFSNSIHSGRTDSRWNRLAGALFETYYCTNEAVAHEKVEALLKKTGSQIMNTMQCLVNCPREGEMFFQFQGDILEVPQIGGAETKRIHVQLDSLPFHLQVMFDEKGYYTELRYWENRFDREILEIFLLCYESVLAAMLEESSVRCLKKYLPQEVFPKHYFTGSDKLNEAAGQIVVKNVEPDENIKVYVFDKEYRKKPYGAWGTVYIMNYEPENFTEVVQYPYGEGVLYGTGLIGRILPDGSIDFLHKTGRVVLTDGVRGRKYYDLKLVEETLLKSGQVRKAECYMAYDTELNEMSLHADVYADKELDVEMLKEYVGGELEGLLIPKYIHIK